MQFRTNHSKSESGAMVFMVMIIISVVLGVIAAGYMLLIASQHRLVSQSMNWNTALALAEAGVEEGLAQLNVNFGTNYMGSAMTNWTYTGSSFGPVTRTMTNGSYSAIIVLNAGGYPSIISTGYAAALYNLPRARRIVCVDTTNYSPFIGAMNVRFDVTTSGSGMMIDGYDSTILGVYNTGGLYDATKRLPVGDVASLYGQVDLQNSTVFGHMRLGVLASYSLNNGSVGDLSWTNNPGQIQPGWLENDFNALWKNVTPPFTSGLAFPNQSGGIHLLTTGNYYVNGNLTIANNRTVRITGDVVLYVTGNVDFKNATGSQMVMDPGSTLKFYVGTMNTASPVSTQLGVVNNTGVAASFVYFGLPSNTSLDWGGNNTYTGVIYAPSAAFSLSGGGATVLDFQGACTVSSVSMNGHFNFHYDQALKNWKPGSAFTISGWREL